MNSLEFLPDNGASINTDQRVLAEKWYNRLSDTKQDKENVSLFLKGCHNWLYDLKFPNSFYVLSAVGSTIEKKDRYEDIDFMLLSNQPKERLKKGNRCYGLWSYIKKHHSAKGASLSLEGLYENLMQGFSDSGRMLWSILPNNGIYSPQTKIHLIVQPLVGSEEGWDQKDRFLKLPLFKLL